MKKINVTLLTLMVAAVAVFAQQPAQKLIAPLAETNTAECKHEFPAVIPAADADFDIFEKQAESFFKTSYFWQNCIRPSLDQGRSINLYFTLYTKEAVPTITENDSAVFAAKEFKGELEDFIEDYQEHIKPKRYTNPGKFTSLALGAPIQQSEYLQTALKRANRKFKAKSKDPKINILIDYKKAPSAKVLGNVLISIK